MIFVSAQTAIGALLVLGSVAVTPPRPASPDGEVGKRSERSTILLKRMDQMISRVHFEETPLEEVFAWFRANGLPNIIVPWVRIAESAGLDPQTPVTLSLERVTLGELLDYALASASQYADTPAGELTYLIRNGVLEITTRQLADSTVVLRTYGVEDLLQRWLMWSDAPAIPVAEGGGGGGSANGGNAGGDPGGGGPGGGGGGIFRGGGGREVDFDALRQERMEQLLEVLHNIHPQTWAEYGGRGTITLFNGRLIIQQTLEMHQLIGGLWRQ